MNAFRLWEEIQWISYLSLIGRLKKNKMSARSESAVEQHTKKTQGGGSGYHGGVFGCRWTLDAVEDVRNSLW